jgi:hypothetical protein
MPCCGMLCPAVPYVVVVCAAPCIIACADLCVLMCVCCAMHCRVCYCICAVQVCPANWKPGDKTIVADPEKSMEYFEAANKVCVGGWIHNLEVHQGCSMLQS